MTPTVSRKRYKQIISLQKRDVNVPDVLCTVFCDEFATRMKTCTMRLPWSPVVSLKIFLPIASWVSYEWRRQINSVRYCHLCDSRANKMLPKSKNREGKLSHAFSDDAFRLCSFSSHAFASRGTRVLSSW